MEELALLHRGLKPSALVTSVLSCYTGFLPHVLFFFSASFADSFPLALVSAYELQLSFCFTPKASNAFPGLSDDCILDSA